MLQLAEKDSGKEFCENKNAVRALGSEAGTGFSLTQHSSAGPKWNLYVERLNKFLWLKRIAIPLLVFDIIASGNELKKAAQNTPRASFAMSGKSLAKLEKVTSPNTTTSFLDFTLWAF